ncbi:MAG: DUF3597 domain-containing protein [Duodenibacillus sp.]|nr:DUF3597 domain-containing protein [Duodenibacillus sp.]HBC69839.1 oxidoreductase [Sutterella sp.]
MGVFSSFMQKLGMLKDKAVAVVTGSGSAKAAEVPAAVEQAAAPAAAVEPVDVVAVCEALAKANPQKLNWKTSIVDLMKLLGIDSSLANRKALAQELNCPAELIGGDYSKMNIWLHKAVMKKLAENGGKVPADLLD